MTDNEINEAIAVHCGWKQQLPNEGRILLPYKYHNKSLQRYELRLPDYANDLNAIHEATRALQTFMDRNNYSLWLLQLTSKVRENSSDFDHRDSPTFYTSTATARQRAEALLRTIGKWKE